MTITVKGITLDLPEGSQVEISEDGSRVKILTSGPTIIEKIRVVEVSVPYFASWNHLRRAPSPTPWPTDPYLTTTTGGPPSYTTTVPKITS